MNNLNIVTDFIEQIWNKRDFDKLDNFLHPNFKDHSLPPALPADKKGLKKWVMGTGISFDHNTIIEDHVSEGDKCILKISMNLKHIGTWHDIEATGVELHTSGYRYFKLKDERIIEHWALIDGQTIENELTKAAHGCKIVL